MSKEKKANTFGFATLEQLRRENPDDYFSAEETERRVVETLRRMGRKPATFDMKTGQNFGEPKLSAEELKRRGYACDPE